MNGNLIILLFSIPICFILEGKIWEAKRWLKNAKREINNPHQVEYYTMMETLLNDRITNRKLFLFYFAIASLAYFIYSCV